MHSRCSSWSLVIFSFFLLTPAAGISGTPQQAPATKTPAQSAQSASTQPSSSQPARPEVANFQDIAQKAGLNALNVFGGKETKKYIIETTGTGIAIIDYDGDGWPDMFVTYYGKNRLYHNQGNGTFKEVGQSAGVAGNGSRWGTGCAFVDYDRDGLLDLMVANYVDFDVHTAPAPGEGLSCNWKGIAVMCGPRGLKPSSNVLYHNLGNGKFADVSKPAGIEDTSGHYCFSVSTL